MKIEYRNIEDIQPYKRNPRKNSIAVDSVAKSISEFDFQNPIIVDDNGVIVAGHTRYLAAKKIGLSSVPVIKAEGLSEQQVRAFRITDNKTP